MNDVAAGAISVSSAGRRAYGAGLAKVLSIPLFLVLLILASKAVQDINNIFAPFAVNYVTETAQYKMLADGGVDVNSNSPAYTQLQQQFQARHEVDQTIGLMVTSFITLVVWLVALSVHFSLGAHKQYYRVLSVPYYLVAACLLLFLLLNIISLLFSKSAMVGLYVALFLVIIVLTASVVLYLKRQNKVAA